MHPIRQLRTITNDIEIQQTQRTRGDSPVTPTHPRKSRSTLFDSATMVEMQSNGVGYDTVTTSASRSCLLDWRSYKTLDQTWIVTAPIDIVAVVLPVTRANYSASNGVRA